MYIHTADIFNANGEKYAVEFERSAKRYGACQRRPTFTGLDKVNFIAVKLIAKT